MHPFNDTFHLILDFNYNQTATYNGLNVVAIGIAFVAGVILSPLVLKAIKNW